MDTVEEILNTSIKAIKIEVSEGEKVQLLKDIERLEEWMRPFWEREPGDTIPVYYPFKAVNVYREDQPQKSKNTSKLTENSGVFNGEYYRIPRVIEE